MSQLVFLSRASNGAALCEASFSALAILGNARVSAITIQFLEVLDREASFFSSFSPHPEVPLLSIAIDGRLSTSALTC